MYVPDYFKVEEFFSKEIIKQAEYTTVLLWQWMDDRLLKTADMLRRAYGPMIVNDYLWGGNNQYRGYRSQIELINRGVWNQTGKIVPRMSSFTSQHCRGAALDATFSNYSVDVVKKDILEHPQEKTFQYITAMEDNVSWLHVDIRNRDKKKYGILVF